jgi:hypothetical protein
MSLCYGCGSPSDQGATNPPDAFTVFNKAVDVFGVKIYGTAATGDDKVLHAASVMAEYLDNDEDGVPDNQEVVDMMVSRNATLVMFKDETEEEKLFQPDRSLFEKYELQNLFHRETHPGGAVRGVFDATLEEVHHLIMFAGYAHVYPEIFGPKTGTSVAEAMDLARGGHFETVPDEYPNNSWYSYDDTTCDYGCMIIEYLYWAHTSILGAQDFSGRLERIEHEWRLNTPEKVQTGDPAIYALFTNPQYRLAEVLPDGNYKGAELRLQRL